MAPGSMPSGHGRFVSSAKVANFCETAMNRRYAGAKPALVRFNVSFFDRHQRPQGADVNNIYDFLAVIDRKIIENCKSGENKIP